MFVSPCNFLYTPLWCFMFNLSFPATWASLTSHPPPFPTLNIHGKWPQSRDAQPSLLDHTAAVRAVTNTMAYKDLRCQISRSHFLLNIGPYRGYLLIPTLAIILSFPSDLGSPQACLIFPFHPLLLTWKKTWINYLVREMDHGLNLSFGQIGKFVSILKIHFPRMIQVIQNPNFVNQY